MKSALRVRIKAWRGFPATLDPLNDRNGHGTHGTSILLQTAPKADVYIARVVHDDGEIPTHDDFAAVGNVSCTIATAINGRQLIG
jgi:hypothetical protein